jgi:DNA-binding NtrC family response regulator
MPTVNKERINYMTNHQEKVLVVDDELLMRDLLYNVLTKNNYLVITAPNGQEAIKLLDQEKPDLVILDLLMPGMNGFETLVKMRQIDPQIEVIILTGANINDLEKQAEKLGVAEVLRKGVGVELFMRSVQYVLEKRKVKRPKPESRTKGTILVVDDEPEIRFMLEKFLTRQGYDVITVGSGEEALKKTSEYITKKEQKSQPTPFIILLDVRMPGMDGLVALNKIKQLDQSIGVIMVSGLNDMEIVQEAMKLGAYDYIMKPFNMEYLEMVVMTKILLAE